ncbi:MAG: glycosyltransferase [Burkholderiales bacterium]|jgi:glycosyltransferase involved in cell wall biosynthesis|uniref:glycosyltransferase family 2 protein n=1 Tax=Roseateles sp. TaxID=1971397 RepID=UPI000F9746BF|nr:MAG: glycosyltransferase [Burkholderiales bacterium]
MTTRLAIIVPCYNEEEVLPETNRRLLQVLTRLQARAAITADSAIYYVDDGSRDRTWSLIADLARQDSRVHGIKLSRNRGHQAALMSGLLTVPGDALISIDADLQDDVDVIDRMVDEHAAGAEIVYGVRDSRQTDTVFKRNTALAYYGLMRKMGVDLIHNHADFRLMGRRAIEALRDYGETNMFLRGIVPLIGYRVATVRYDRAERFAGVSKYPLRKMLTFALEGITSFSVVPLRLITLLGVLISVASFAMIVFVVYVTLVLRAVVPGWASTVVPIYFLGGIQMLSMGVIGEYVAKIYLETKRRPRYLIEATV